MAGPIAVGPIAVGPIVAGPGAAETPAPKPEFRPEVASPSGSLPPPAPALPANPPELPDPIPAGVATADPAPVPPEPLAAGPMRVGTAATGPAPAGPVPPGPVPAGTVIVDGGEDVNPDDDTAPIPMITPDMPKPGPAVQAPATAAPAASPATERIRAPFEPPERRPQPEPEPEPEPDGVQLDQLKDLYLTAEAIGEDALTKHFQQVSDRQRQLIREYFDQVTTHDPQDQAES